MVVPVWVPWHIFLQLTVVSGLIVLLSPCSTNLLLYVCVYSSYAVLQTTWTRLCVESTVELQQPTNMVVNVLWILITEWISRVNELVCVGFGLTTSRHLFVWFLAQHVFFCCAFSVTQGFIVVFQVGLLQSSTVPYLPCLFVSHTHINVYHFNSIIFPVKLGHPLPLCSASEADLSGEWHRFMLDGGTASDYCR